MAKFVTSVSFFPCLHPASPFVGASDIGQELTFLLSTFWYQIKKSHVRKHPNLPHEEGSLQGQRFISLDRSNREHPWREHPHEKGITYQDCEEPTQNSIVSF